ncbi:MAG TPA: hypothetical protein VH684_06320 [Xanthobacteraceae bacterium]|jgi:hypothetical protein
MATLRENARAIDWQQALADAQAIAMKQLTVAQLPTARQNNLQRARDVMTTLAEHESYYREQTIKRLDNYQELKGKYAKYIEQRDEAAWQGKVGSSGLIAFYTIDMIGDGLAAAGIPLAKFYATVRGVSDKAVATYEALRQYWGPAPTAGSSGTASGPQQIAETGVPAASRSTGTSAETSASPDRSTPSSSAQRLAERTPDQQIRAVTGPLEAARSVQKAIEETAQRNDSLPGIDRFKQWTTPHPQAENAESKTFSVSKGAGQIADTTLKTINSIADLQAARRSGDETRIVEAEMQAARDALKSGSTLLDIAQKDQKLAGIRGRSGEFPVEAQFMKGFATAEKVVGGAQSAMQAADAYYDARDGNYQKAWDHARDGVTNAAKTFTRYGEQVEAGGKAIDAMTRYAQAKDGRERLTSFMEYLGYGTKAAVVPGASDAGEAILKAKDVVEQGFNLKEAYDLGREDSFKPNLDRLGKDIVTDYQLYTKLNEFRPIFDLPRPQPVTPTSSSQ